MNIKVSLSQKSIESAIKQVEQYKNSLRARNELFVRRLAEIGITDVNSRLSQIGASLPHDEPIGTAYIENSSLYNVARMKIVVASSMILFVEFGTGIRYVGTQNPKAAEMGYGPGTYPGKGHWDDPNGWNYEDKTGVFHHTYGIKAQMPMYKASVDLRAQILTIAREVFKSD